MPTQMAGGLDSLLSMVQMPSGIPVAVVSTGKAGPKNAALLAVSVIGVKDTALRRKLERARAAMRKRALQDDSEIRKSLGKLTEV